jgi:hypothetical protein
VVNVANPGSGKQYKPCTVVRSKDDVRMTDFTEVPIQTPECRLTGIAKAEDGVVDSGDGRKNVGHRFVGRGGGVESFHCQVKNRSKAQNVNQENAKRAEEEDGKARALGVGEVKLRFGLSLVCGLFVHGESVAQDERFNRRESRWVGTLRARERRGMGRHEFSRINTKKGFNHKERGVGWFFPRCR